MNAQERKQRPVATGVLDYFPLAIMEIAHVSWKGNDQHNPNTPVHWDRAKSTDEADALMRHFLERGKLDTDGIRHSAKMAWRALALLQKELEQDERTTKEVWFQPTDENEGGKDRDRPLPSHIGNEAGNQTHGGYGCYDR